MECSSDFSTENYTQPYMSLSSSCRIDYRPEFVSNTSDKYEDSAIGESCLDSNSNDQHIPSTDLISRSGREFRDFRSFCTWLVSTKPDWCDWTPVTDIQNNLSGDLLRQGREILWKHTTQDQSL